MNKFNYEQVIFGVGNISKNEKSMQGLRLQYLLNCIKNEKGKFLEVGCGVGRLIRGIRRYRDDLDFYGCDISRNAIDLAHKENGNIKYVVSDALNLCWASNAFNIIAVLDVFEHLIDLDKAVFNVNKSLKIDGLFYLVFPCEGRKYSLYWFLNTIKIGHNLKKKHVGHVQNITHETLRSCLERNGFRIKHIYYSYHFIGQIMDFLNYVNLSFVNLQSELFNNEKNSKKISTKNNISSDLSGGKTESALIFLKRVLGIIYDLLFNLFYRILEILSYYESTILKKNCCGMTAHIVCIKEV